MRIWQTSFAAAVVATTWIAAPGHSRASTIIDATFTGATGALGTVSLEIVLPDNANNNTTAATAVYITSATISLPGPAPYDTIGSAYANTFTLSNGALTGYDYGSELVQERNFVYGLSFTDTGDALETSGGLVENSNPSLFVVNSVTLPQSTPEPGALSILGTGLAALLLSRSWTKRRNRPVRSDLADSSLPA